MLISTVTLSPAIDRTYYVDGFSVDSLNRAWQVKTNMGGKGINFAAIISECAIPGRVLGFLGNGGEKIEKFLHGCEIDTNFVYTEGEVRVNIKICDLEKETYTDLNECGFPIAEAEIKKLCGKINAAASDSDFLYMGGTLPPGLADDTYADFVRRGREHDAITVVDASGAALARAVEEKPDIIKPNRHEAQELLGRKIKSLPDALNAAREIYEGGVKNAIITLGGDGAVCACDEGVFRVYPLCVPVKSTVGAGDSFLAGFVYGRARKMGAVSALKYAMSFSAAKIQKEGTDIPSLAELTSSVGNIICEEIR